MYGSSGNGKSGAEREQRGASALARFVGSARRLLVLTGAGCSTESGIPDYRDASGAWKHRRPVLFAAFIGSELARKRYWARSLAGWPAIAQAEPNEAHRALARLERSGRIHHLITQNVDGLHQRAGSRRVIDLHGRLDTVICLDCDLRLPRADFQGELRARNPDWVAARGPLAPDGDAALEDPEWGDFHVPACPRCRGILKPDVVFFGESVPRERVVRSMARVEEADALLVVGSSLMVWSGFRFARAAAERRIPIAAINLGTTRADDTLQLKIAARCGEVLAELADRLALRAASGPNAPGQPFPAGGQSQERAQNG